MKNLIRIAAIVLAAAVAAPAVAQQQQQQGKVGVGVGLSNGDAFGTLLFVPVNITPQFRLEPFLGWSRADIDQPNAGGASMSTPGKSSDVMLGAGAFFLMPAATQVQLYAGGRLGLEWQSRKGAGANADKLSRRNTLLALAAGGEYMPIPRVAVGAELQVGYVWIGDTKYQPGTPGQPTVESGGGSATETQGTVFVRVFLF